MEKSFEKVGNVEALSDVLEGPEAQFGSVNGMTVRETQWLPKYFANEAELKAQRGIVLNSFLKRSVCRRSYRNPSFVRKSSRRKNIQTD